MILHCMFWLLIESFVAILVHCLLKLLLLLLLLLLQLSLPYHSFIDSRLSKSKTIFLVSKWNGINESKESNNSCLEINYPSIYEWLNDISKGINKQKCVVCDIGYCKVGKKDGVMMIPVRWQCEVMIDMDWNDWMWICQIEHPLAILKDGVSVILVLVTLVSRSK